MINFKGIRGKVTRIEDVAFRNEKTSGCVKMVAIIEEMTGGEVTFVLTPDTYVLNQEMIRIGDTITGYIDANAPTILIYPPQYQALVIVVERQEKSVKVAYFNDKLVSLDNELQINPSPHTIVTTENGQAFTQSINNRNLIVIYTISTKSIPALTTPERIIVLCSLDHMNE